MKRLENTIEELEKIAIFFYLHVKFVIFSLIQKKKNWKEN